MEEIKNKNFIKPLILNKIKHKPNMIFYIFPFVTERIFILPYLIESDSFLKNSFKKSLNNMRSKNFSKESIDLIHKFMVYNLMQGVTIDYFGKYIINSLFDEFYYGRAFQSLSILDNFKKDIIKCFKNKPIPINMNIDMEIIERNLPKGLKLDKFMEDYFNDELILFYMSLDNHSALYTNKDIIYLNNLNTNNNYKKILNLICIITINFFYYNKNMIKINYKYIKKLYFIYYDDYFNNIFDKIEFFLNCIEHRENIKYIYFHNSFSKEENKKTIYYKDFIVYKKIGLEYLLDDYYQKINNKKKINMNLNSLENIEFDDDNLINAIQIFRLRYNLNNMFFTDKFCCKIIMITPDDFDNIYNLSDKEENDLNKKLDKFENENTKYKILYLNFNNTSPYTKNFVYFCDKYLYFNKNINIIIIDNIQIINGINKDYDYKNIKKLKFPNLKCIIFEDKIISDNLNITQNEENSETDDKIYDFHNNDDLFFDTYGVKTFINQFFDLSNYNIYEGYNNKNHLLYLNIVKNICVDELYRIFFIENKISMLKFIKENIEIKFNKTKMELSLINKNNEKEKKLKLYKIKSYKDFFEKLNKIIDLHFDNGKILYSDESEEEIEEQDEEEDQNQEIERDKEENDNDSNNSINKIGNFLNSEILTEESEFSLLAEGILEIENVSEINQLKFNLTYRSKSDKNKIDKIIEKIGKNKYILLLIKTNKGNIFGAYTYFYDYYNNKEKDRKLGVVFSFKNGKLFYDVEGFIWKNDEGIEIKNYFYITKPSFGLKNKITNNLMEIGESNFTCFKIEAYDIN